MELQTFVENTLTAIVRGVQSAHKAAPGVAPLLEPPGEGDDVAGLIFTRDGGNLQPVFIVEFDVAVSADKKTESQVGGGIRVLEFISGSVNHSLDSHDSTVSRIKFRIPLQLTNNDA